MKLPTTLLAVLVAGVVAPAGAVNPATSGALPVPANRIVGLWDNTAQVGPCNGAPNAMLRQTLMFDAGGTFVDNSPFPPNGLPNVYGVAGNNQRSIGLGTWKYNPYTARYTLDQRFYWFVDNAYHGYQVVHRTIQLSHDGNTASGPVHTVRYAANGSVVIELCGNASSTRI